MKTQKNTLSNPLSYLLLMFILLSFLACNSQDKKTEKTDSAITKTELEPPSVDIHTATFLGNTKALKQHIEAGTDLNVKDQYGSTPLIIATTFGKTDMAKTLINAGADLHITNNEGATPLHIASFFCRTDIVKALLEKGADKTLKNNYGSTPLQSVSGAFNDAKPIYDQLSKDLGPLGLKFDYKHLETERPIIAELLK